MNINGMYLLNCNLKRYGLLHFFGEGWPDDWFSKVVSKPPNHKQDCLIIQQHMGIWKWGLPWSTAPKNSSLNGDNDHPLDVVFWIPIWCSMVLEYAHQHLPLPKITQSCRFLYTSTMGCIWDMLFFTFPKYSKSFYSHFSMAISGT